jgi:hypothetical protein
MKTDIARINGDGNIGDLNGLLEVSSSASSAKAVAPDKTSIASPTPAIISIFNFIKNMVFLSASTATPKGYAYSNPLAG